MSFVHWLQNHLIPCPFKWLTTLDCPGCGFQRSFLALVAGDLSTSFRIYPPLIPLLCLFTYSALRVLISFPKQDFVFKIMVLVVGNLILLNYMIKMITLFNRP
ncbi:DUF2752 domain-containing protein [Pedobacter sp. AW1-32]|uniref:DUF2752 domain-containing protein n=1 Tax=Pedobacter sp. AW1-32 TaxID=3383026 RepID=UPI003FF15518